MVIDLGELPVATVGVASGESLPSDRIAYCETVLSVLVVSPVVLECQRLPGRKAGDCATHGVSLNRRRDRAVTSATTTPHKAEQHGTGDQPPAQTAGREDHLHFHLEFSLGTASSRRWKIIA